MKVAIVHDWLVTNAGAEKVLRALIDIYSDATIYSLVDFLDKKDREKVLNGKFVETTFIQNLPFAKNHFRNYLFLFPMAIESLDLSGFDIIISSSWAVAKGVKKTDSQIHFCYCHTPIRYAWDLYDEYTQNLKQPKKFIVQLTLKYIKKWDINTLNRVDFFIANSQFVANRISKTYKRDSIVINPPVDIDKFKLKEKKDDFYLTASRLVPYKKTKLIVEAFNELLDKKLVVIGAGEELKAIKEIAKENIEVLGYQEDELLTQYMQKAKGFIYAAIEDFGIVPIEAMACGTPVIALKDGATAQTITDEITGVHFKNQTVKDIKIAVGRFEEIEFDYKSISNEVNNYSSNRFKKELEYFINSHSK